MNTSAPPIAVALSLALFVAGCGGQTPEQKAAEAARAVAQVEAAQKLKPPIEPLELGAVDPSVRRLYKLSGEGCAFFSDPNPGAFPLVVIGLGKAVLQLNGQPAIFAVDNGSPALAGGMHTKYDGRTHWVQIAQAPDRVTIRDRYERIVYETTGRIDCQT